MSVAIDMQWDSGELAFLRSRLTDKPLARTVRKAGNTALRDARSEASKRIRQRKRVKAQAIRRAFVLARPKGAGDIGNMEWRIDVKGDPVPLSAYPHRQTKKGVSVEVNRGKRTIRAGAFVALMRSGHKGVFVRQGMKRLPIRELLGSRPVDALLHPGEVDAVLQRGRASFSKAFARLLPIELEKAGRR